VQRPVSSLIRTRDDEKELAFLTGNRNGAND
jgi:hypothetical protein